MDFPLGRPILALLILATLTAVPVALRRPPNRADLVVWTFAANEINPAAIKAFQARTDQSVSVELLSTRALDTRLISRFMSGGGSADMPDLVEIEIGSIGKFLRPAVDQIGLLSLNQLLKDSGLDQQLLPARLAAWSKDGVVFGLPQDVHPVSLTYRKDLFDAAGVDPKACRSWEQLRQACEHFNFYWANHSEPERRALMLSPTAANDLMIMLQQRHVNLIDADNHTHLADGIVADTLLEYAKLISVSGEASPGEMQWANDLERGDLCMMLMPDWKAQQLKQLAPSLAGKLAMMQLPRFQTGDAPTASWGGTMIGLPRAGSHPQNAAALAEYLTTHPPAGRISALPAQWNDPAYQQHDPFFTGQQVDRLYTHLAAQLPVRVITPFTALAEIELADVLRKTVQASRHEVENRDDCLAWLRIAQVDLEERMSLADEGAK